MGEKGKNKSTSEKSGTEVWGGKKGGFARRFFFAPIDFFPFPPMRSLVPATVDPVLILEDADFAYDLAAL